MNSNKVFRHHQGAACEDWSNTAAYGQNEIDGIEDPAGATPTRPITSIPSPFARIDLFKTAFRNVVAKYGLDGNTVYHKLVSDCLDIGEIFFNYDRYAEILKIVSWDKDTDLNKLLNSSLPKHHLLGESLKLFIQQDGDVYGFTKLRQLYLLIYDHKVIGGTSPATLFFSSANKLDFAQIEFEKNTLFSDDYTALYKRDPEYLKYLYTLFLANAGLREEMHEFENYIQMNVNKLQNENHDLWNEVNTITPNHIRDYHELNTGIENNVVEVFGHSLRKREEENIKIQESDFLIKSEKKAHLLKPLVLQKGLNKPFRYSTDVWNEDIKVPYFDPNKLSDRRLPGIGQKYPYLTVSDLLEPFLLQVPFSINKEKYFDGNLDSRIPDEGFLLPIKPVYFEFFDSEDLLKSTQTGQKIFEMKRIGEGIKAILRVPIKRDGEYITYERIYTPPTVGYENPIPDERLNQGYILKTSISVATIPLFKIENNPDGFYRILLLDRNVPGQEDCKLELYEVKEDGISNVIPTSESQRSNKNTDHIGMRFYVLENKTFDVIRLIAGGSVQATIVPRFTVIKEGTKPFKFAIDFGTTNTHIEYSIDGGPSQPFEIIQSDMQMATLTKPDDDVITAPELAFLPKGQLIPNLIGRGEYCSFPQRTVIGYNSNININSPTFMLADYVLPFMYEKDKNEAYTNIKPNLKWSNYTKEKEAHRSVEMFFEELLFLIRNKIILNHGKLDRTELIWFYPSSMLPHRRNSLGNAWVLCLKKYIFDKKDGITDKEMSKCISESLAPFYYYKKNKRVSSLERPAVAIDIGGGTTDIVILYKDKPCILSSFKFAANTIFGDGYNSSIDNNGFVFKYKAEIEGQLRNNKLHNLVVANEEIYKRQKSEDLITFWFSLENHKDIIAKQIPISLSKNLRNDENLRFVFFLFLSAIIFHVARLMKASNIAIPANITFSGTGSKILDYLGDKDNLSNLSLFIQCLFSQVYGLKTKEIITITRESQPKEVTCKGGLEIESKNIVDLENIRTILIGGNNNIVNNTSMIKYSDIRNNIEQYKNDIKKEYDDFFNTLKEITASKTNISFDIKGNLGVSLNPEYLDIIGSNLREYIELGFAKVIEELEVNSDEEITETLFFYPLVGAINKLAYHIARG